MDELPDVLRLQRRTATTRAGAAHATIYPYGPFLSFDAVIDRLDHAQIANARVNDMQGVWNHPQLQARGRWREVETSAGPIPSLIPPGSNNAFEPRMDAVPDLGQHTEQAQRTGQIKQMRVAGAI